MPVQLYQKKPVVVKAIQFWDNNQSEIEEFVGSSFLMIAGLPYIETLEGNMTVSKNDYIIQGVKGEYYPCKPDIFEMTYDCEDKSTLIRNQIVIILLNYDIEFEPNNRGYEFKLKLNSGIYSVKCRNNNCQPTCGIIYHHKDLPKGQEFHCEFDNMEDFRKWLIEQEKKSYK